MTGARERFRISSRSMRRRAALTGILAIAAGASSCQSFSKEDTREMVADIAEFLGRSDPSRHAGKLSALHDTATFAHRPDLPPTTGACLEEVRILAASGYASWREVAVATFLVTRVAAEDAAALNRGEAVRALERLGAMVQEAEDPPAAGTTEEETSKAIHRLHEIHDPASGLHRAEAAVCREILRALGSFAVSLRAEAPEAQVRLELRLLRGMLMGVVAETRSEEAHGAPEDRDAVDRAVVNLAAQAVRLSVAAALRFDPQATVRAAAARAAGALRSPALAGVLGGAFAREDATGVRREIVLALGRSCAAPGQGREAAVPVLVVALEDGDESVAANAREALRALAGRDLGPRPEPWIAWWGQERSRGGR